MLLLQTTKVTTLQKDSFWTTLYREKLQANVNPEISINID